MRVVEQQQQAQQPQAQQQLAGDVGGGVSSLILDEYSAAVYWRIAAIFATVAALFSVAVVVWFLVYRDNPNMPDEKDASEVDRFNRTSGAESRQRHNLLSELVHAFRHIPSYASTYDEDDESGQDADCDADQRAATQSFPRRLLYFLFGSSRSAAAANELHEERQQQPPLSFSVAAGPPQPTSSVFKQSAERTPLARKESSTRLNDKRSKKDDQEKRLPDVARIKSSRGAAVDRSNVNSNRPSVTKADERPSKRRAQHPAPVQIASANNYSTIDILKSNVKQFTKFFNTSKVKLPPNAEAAGAAVADANVKQAARQRNNINNNNNNNINSNNWKEMFYLTDADDADDTDTSNDTYTVDSRRKEASLPLMSTNFLSNYRLNKSKNKNKNNNRVSAANLSVKSLSSSSACDDEDDAQRLSLRSDRRRRLNISNRFLDELNKDFEQLLSRRYAEATLSLKYSRVFNALGVDFQSIENVSREHQLDNVTVFIDVYYRRQFKQRIKAALVTQLIACGQKEPFAYSYEIRMQRHMNVDHLILNVLLVGQLKTDTKSWIVSDRNDNSTALPTSPPPLVLTSPSSNSMLQILGGRQINVQQLHAAKELALVTSLD